jgi:rsbT co-antagonist protein RsbR
VLAHSPLPDGLWHELKAGLEQGGDWSREVRYRVDDAERVVANQVVSVYDGRGDVQGHLWLFRDLTELRHSQGLVEAQNRELQTAIAELDNSRRVYSQLLETVRTLAAPAVPVLEGIIVMPLSGQIDSERAQRILDNLLAGIVEQQAKIAIIDITGVPVVDTAVAEYLIQAARAASLMGCRSLLVGIRPEIAQVIVELGIDMSGLMTFGDLQGGVEYALRALGMTLEYVPDARRRETAR